MADPIQGQPGETSQATAAETTPPEAVTTGAAENADTTQTPTVPDATAVDWDKVDVTDYQRLKAEIGGIEEQGTPAPETPEKPAEQSQSQEQKTDETPPPNPDAEKAKDEEESGPFGAKFRPRLGILEKEQQEVVQLVREMKEKGDAISFAEAESRVAAKYGRAQKKEDEPAPDAPPEKSSSELDQQIKDLRAQRRKAGTDADLEAVTRLDDEIAEAIEAKKTAEVRESEATNAAEARLNEAKAQVRKDFPGHFDDENGPLAKEFQRVFDELATAQDPILSLAPERQVVAISKIAAANLGIKKGTPKNAQQPVTSTLSPTPQTTRPVQPASGSARTVRPATDPLTARLEAVKTKDDYDKFKAENGLN